MTHRSMLGKNIASLTRPLHTHLRTMSSLAGKNLISIADLSSEQLEGLIQHSIDIKTAFKTDPAAARQLQPLKGVTMSMIFQKRSTRTRVSTESGMHMLGGHGLMYVTLRGDCLIHPDELTR